MFDPVQDIADFHQKFELAYTGPPRDLSSEVSVFRRDFLDEELTEYIFAVEDRDLERQFDALIDLVYVALGTAYLQGFDFREGWRRVHEANMRKVRAQRPQDSARNNAHDVVKPPGWQPASLTDLVQG